jgi:hypothetical protein
MDEIALQFQRTRDEKLIRKLAVPLTSRFGPRQHGGHNGTMSQIILRWLVSSLVVAIALLPGCATLFDASATAATVSNTAPPPPAPVPENASVVTGTVRKYTVWPPGLLKNTLPIVPPDQTLYSLMLEIHTSNPESSQLESLARPGMVVEVFSSEPLGSELVGKKIEATLKMRGDTRGVRWMISNIRAVP